MKLEWLELHREMYGGEYTEVRPVKKYDKHEPKVLEKIKKRAERLCKTSRFEKNFRPCKVTIDLDMQAAPEMFSEELSVYVVQMAYHYPERTIGLSWHDTDIVYHDRENKPRHEILEELEERMMDRIKQLFDPNKIKMRIVYKKKTTITEKIQEVSLARTREYMDQICVAPNTEF